MERTKLFFVVLGLCATLGCSKKEKVAALTEDNQPPEDVCGAVEGRIKHTGPPPVLVSVTTLIDPAEASDPV